MGIFSTDKFVEEYKKREKENEYNSLHHYLYGNSSGTAVTNNVKSNFEKMIDLKIENDIFQSKLKSSFSEIESLKKELDSLKINQADYKKSSAEIEVQVQKAKNEALVQYNNQLIQMKDQFKDLANKMIDALVEKTKKDPVTPQYVFTGTSGLMYDSARGMWSGSGK